jgi:Domain of unknown function (DUF6089)
MLKYIFIVFCFLPVLSFSQKWDIGLHIGASGYMGEINQINPFQFNEPNFGIHVRKNLDPSFSFRVGLDQAWIIGIDANSKNPDQIQRNLSFASSITEASFIFEFNFYKFNPYDHQMRFSPYLMTGITGFYYNPFTYLNGNKVFLKSVGTEGQFIPPPLRKDYYPKQYSNLSFSIPIGFGIKYHLKGPFSLQIEYGYRMTFTDYLDDIGGAYPDLTGVNLSSNIVQLSNRSATYKFTAGNQRGDSRKYDKYFFGTASIFYTFRSIECPKFKP